MWKWYLKLNCSFKSMLLLNSLATRITGGLCGTDWNLDGKERIVACGEWQQGDSHVKSSHTVSDINDLWCISIPFSLSTVPSRSNLTGLHRFSHATSITHAPYEISWLHTRTFLSEKQLGFLTNVELQCVVHHPLHYYFHHIIIITISCDSFAFACPSIVSNWQDNKYLLNACVN